METVVNEATYQAAFLTSLKASRLVDRDHEFSIPLPTEESYLGYDVRMDFEKVGIPVFFQFKVPMKTTVARKDGIAGELKKDTSKLDYRMILRKKDNFSQHRLLMNIDNACAPAVVYYSTPNYRTEYEYRAAVKKNYIQYKSTFLSPREIGTIPTHSAHEINYFIGADGALVYPSKSLIDTYTFDDVIGKVNEKMERHNAPLRVNIDTMIKLMIEEDYEKEMEKLKHIVQEIRSEKHTKPPKDDGTIALQFMPSFNVDMNTRDDDDELNYFKLLFLQFLSRTLIGSEVVVCCLRIPQSRL